MTSGLHVRLADTRDIMAIYELLAAAGQALVQEGFENWANPYPAERLRGDLAAREVYVVEQEQALVATYMLGTTAVHPYEPSPWPEARALYLNRMAVKPTLRGRGLGSFALTQVALRARELGVAAVRCDVLEANSRLCRFYERHGYASRGTRTHSGWQFLCYEWLVRPVDSATLDRSDG